ncbi:MAG: Sortase domain [Chloroflexota bacterium]|nr:Sortase domain [Chloroflexota bacterium]
MVAGTALILAGALLIAGWGRTAGGPPAVPPSASATAGAAASTSTSAAPSATRDPRAPIAAGYRVQIPRLGIDLPLAEGDLARDIDQQKTPENFAFHLPGTSIPGLGSNTYIYAHARTGMFLTLWNAKVGDEVFISTPDLRALKYVVTEVHPRVAPDDVSWVQPTQSERVTLQTSTGPNPSDPRFVVVAIPAT